MAQIIPFTMRRFNGVDYDTLYPANKADNVYFDNTGTGFTATNVADVLKQTASNVFSITVDNTGWTEVSGLTKTWRKQVTIPDIGSTVRKKVDLQQNSGTINLMLNGGVTNLYFANMSNVIYLYAVGAQPTFAMTLQGSFYNVYTTLSNIIGDGISVGGGKGGGFIFQDNAPEDTDVLWIDTSDGYNILKYYNGSSWIAVNGAWA